MKNILKTSAVLFALLMISVSFISKPETIEITTLVEQEGITIPENIQLIIEAKCMNCHKPDARNEKAKEKLQWEKVAKMNKEEQTHLIAELFEVLEEGKMPPARTVERNPESKLTDDETKALLAWVEVEEKRIKGK
ncbi:heme-binding domain-containing protein [Roseivirga sp.]|uniref:heme-binding domain-containing protein n=1 Tax=Roseivirga sp. TaxID=1964215 RepID=UPI002B27A66F|nr:heme-binding domain-containing protein [Roseivirga sp.]